MNRGANCLRPALLLPSNKVILALQISLNLLPWSLSGSQSVIITHLSKVLHPDFDG